MFEKHIQKLFLVNMNLRSDETVLVFTDSEKDYLINLTDSFLSVARELSIEARGIIYSSLKGHGKEPPEDVWKLAFGTKAIEELRHRGLLHKVLHKENYSESEVYEVLSKYAERVPDVVIALSYYSTTHTFFRKALTELFGCRYASMPLFEPEMFLGPMDVDWSYVAALSRDVADILSEAEWVHIKAEDTDLEFSLEGRKAVADTGLFHKKGEFGNLPAGEAFIAPLEDSAFGKLTLSYAPSRRLERPLSLKFRKGSVEELEGYEPYREELERVFKEHHQARVIAEFGVGTNPKARRPDNLIEAEKILGTVHVAIGDNHSFGGKNRVPFHTDYVIFEPQVILGGKGWQKKLLEKGKLMT